MNQENSYSKERYIHLLLRSNLKHPLFVTKSDYASFMKFLEVKLRQYEINLIGYVLLPTHFHLLLWGPTNLNTASFIHGLCVLYTKYYHRKFDTVGSLFSKSYQKDILKTSKELMSCLRYLHQIPKHQGYCHTMYYPYSSYDTYMNPDQESLVNRQILYRLLDMKSDEKAANLFKCIHHDKAPAPIIDINKDLTRQVSLAKSIMKEEMANYDIDYDLIPKDYQFRERLVLKIHRESSLTHQEIADLLSLSRHIVGRIIRMNKAS